MAWKDLSYDKKVSLRNSVSVACFRHNLQWLKEALPTVQDLVEYGDTCNGGGFLHTLMYACDTDEKSSSVEFLKEVMKAYDLEKNPELMEKLFLERNAGGKLAADFTYVYQYILPEYKKNWEKVRGHDVSTMTDLTDRRTQGEKNKIILYKFIKGQILALKSASTQEQAHAIIKPYKDRSDEHFDKFPRGTPISSAYYLRDKNGKRAFDIIGSVHEEYPEIRLRNFASDENKEDYCVLRGLRPDSKESLLSQAIDKMDFPDDYVSHFHALRVFEDDYKRLNADEGLNATYRYFTIHRGAVVFESKQDETALTNGNSGGSYGGYCQSYIMVEDGKKVVYPVVVIPCEGIGTQFYNEENKEHWMNNNERILYHELFHVIDLGEGFHFSEMPIFQYALMLTETDKNNKITDPFYVVNRYYPASEYHKEMAAQIMGIADASVLEKSPLLQRIHKLGHYFAIAKCNDKKAVMSSLSDATEWSSYGSDLRIAHMQFMAAKKEGKPFEFDADKRKILEERFIKLLDKTIVKTENSLGISPHDQNMTQQTR